VFTGIIEKVSVVEKRKKKRKKREERVYSTANGGFPEKKRQMTHEKTSIL